MSRPRSFGALVFAAAILVPALAAAQTPEEASEQATNACLLLRPASDCLSRVMQPFSSPGDSMSLHIWRPAASAGARARAEPTYVTGEVAADIVLESKRQVISIPVSWSPTEWLTTGAVIPLIHQSLSTGDQFSIGDVALTVGASFPIEPLQLRAVGALKMPTGSPDSGTGSGAFDAMGFADAWYYVGDLGLVASAGYRYNGRDGFSGLVQESIGAEYGIYSGMFGVAFGARLFAHQRLAEETETSMHAVFSVQPRIVGFGLGYVGLFMPLATGQDLLTDLVLSAGFAAPFGRAPARHRSAALPEPIAAPRVEASTPAKDVAQPPAPVEAQAAAPVTAPAIDGLKETADEDKVVAATPVIAPISTVSSTSRVTSNSATAVLGVRVLSHPEGLLIFSVDASGAAAAAGLSVGDRIRAVDGVTRSDEAALDRALSERAADSLRLDVSGPSGDRVVVVTVPERAPESAAAAPLAPTTTSTGAADLK